MKTYESRKQLLIAESELNRAHLVLEWERIGGEAGAIASQAKSIKSIASAAATLVAGLSSLRHETAAPAAPKPLWWQTVAQMAGMVSTFWSTFRSRSQP